MKRLRDQRNSDDPLTARVAELVASVGPTPESPARMRRIRRRLDQRPHRYDWRALRPIAAFALVFGGAATAAAGYGLAQIFVPSADSAQKASEVTAAPTPTPARGTGHVPAVDETSSTIEPAETSTTETAAPTAGLPSSDAAVTPRRSSSKGHAASEASIVQRGLEALRNEKDPKKAAAYLDEYRREHPDGALAEEALALSVEAAAASGDPRVSRLAKEYLARYPRGRFREAARRASAKTSNAGAANGQGLRSEDRKRGQ